MGFEDSMKKTLLILFATLITGISVQAQTFVGSWKLTSIVVEQDMVFVISSPITMNISKDNKIGGNGGCNSFGGSYKYKRSTRIKFFDIISTQMFCEGSSDTERMLFRSLRDADRISVKKGVLTIENQKIGNVMTFERAEEKKD